MLKFNLDQSNQLVTLHASRFKWETLLEFFLKDFVYKTKAKRLYIIRFGAGKLIKISYIKEYVQFLDHKTYILKEIILLLKSLRNYIRRNKGNFTMKCNSNKIMLCGGGGNNILFSIRFQ